MEPNSSNKNSYSRFLAVYSITPHSEEAISRASPGTGHWTDQKRSETRYHGPNNYKDTKH